MTRIILLLTVVALASCAAPMHWEKPGVTAEDFLLDRYSCKRDVSQALRMNLDAQDSMFKECMFVHGYRIRPGVAATVAAGGVAAGD